MTLAIVPATAAIPIGLERDKCMPSHKASPAQLDEQSSAPKRPRGRPRHQRPSQDDPNNSERRTEILAVSAQLFAEFGFESTTIRQIAEKVGLLPGSLYYYFPNKEDILHEIIRDPVAKTVRDNLRIDSLRYDAEHRLVANIIARLHRFINDWAALTVLQNDRKFLSRNVDFNYVDPVKDKSIELLQSTLNDGMQSGLFRKGIDTSLMIGAISRMLSSAATLFKSGDIFDMDSSLAYPLDSVIDFYLDCILRMVRTPARIDAPIPRALCESIMIG